jgi:hypothetical protein
MQCDHKSMMRPRRLDTSPLRRGTPLKYCRLSWWKSLWASLMKIFLFSYASRQSKSEPRSLFLPVNRRPFPKLLHCETYRVLTIQDRIYDVGSQECRMENFAQHTARPIQLLSRSSGAPSFHRRRSVHTSRELRTKLLKRRRE